MTMLSCGHEANGERIMTAGIKHAPLEACTICNTVEPATPDWTALMSCGHRVTAGGVGPWKAGSKSLVSYARYCEPCKCGEIKEEPAPILGRTAKCVYGCGAIRTSSVSLPFFQHVPERACDEFYCGCKGWD